MSPNRPLDAHGGIRTISNGATQVIHPKNRGERIRWVRISSLGSGLNFAISTEWLEEMPPEPSQDDIDNSRCDPSLPMGTTFYPSTAADWVYVGEFQTIIVYNPASWGSTTFALDWRTGPEWRA